MNPSDKDSRLQDEIDANLKRAYDDVLNEDVPDRFTQLLQQLKDKPASSASNPAHDSRSAEGSVGSEK